jgi:hypothetical protein
MYLHVTIDSTRTPPVLRDGWVDADEAALQAHCEAAS